MNTFDKVLCTVSPKLGLRRLQARHALKVLQGTTMQYDAATTGRRASSIRAGRHDADGAAGFGRRSRMAAVGHDLVRNNPFAARAIQAIVANTVADGIIPRLTDAPEDLGGAALKIIENHLDTTAIDVDGRLNLYGLQRLIMNTVATAGEALVVRHDLPLSSDMALPLQIQVLEPDHLDSFRDGSTAAGGRVFDGIQYDQNGKREGYWLFTHHPGAVGGMGGIIGQESVFLPADRVLHIYKQDRPGQMRGVSWLSPVTLILADLYDYSDAQLMRQKIAACFVAFRKRAGGDPTPAQAQQDFSGTLSPGIIQDLAPDEEITFGRPPEVSDFDPFTKTLLRQIAAGMGITYESLTGDLSGVNFSSARMGRMEMDRNISEWQWLMLIPQFLQPLGGWILRAWAAKLPARVLDLTTAKFDWTPPHRFIVDPAREIPALIASVRAGFQSLQGVQRQFGFDPERILSEQLGDRKKAEEHGLIFDTDASRTSGSGVTQARPAGSEFPDTEEDSEHVE